MRSSYIILLLATISYAFAEEVELSVPYDKGGVTFNGKEYNLALSDDKPFISFWTNAAPQGERLVISGIRGKIDNFEIVVRDADGKRLYDLRQAQDNGGVLSVPGVNGRLFVYVTKTTKDDVPVRFLVSKLSKAQLDAIDAMIRSSDGE